MDILKSDCVKRELVLKEIERFKGYLDEDMILRLQIAMKRLPSAETYTRYKPPKRIPCVCGRKQIELWWNSERDSKGEAYGWFMRCPQCGLQSPYFKYESHKNEVWNETVTKKMEKLPDLEKI